MTNSTAPAEAASAGRLRLAIIANAPTPYRTHLHRRIATEMPEIELWSVYTHEASNAPWSVAKDDVTRPIWFGPGERAERQGDPAVQWHEWRKGGRITRWLGENRIGAVIVHGYNDSGRLRIFRWCWLRGVPCWLSADSNIRGDRTTGVKAWLKRTYVGWAIRRSVGVLPCGSLGRDYFLRYGASADRIHTFPCEPDYQLIQSLPQEAVTAAAERFGLSLSRRRLVYSGRLVEFKRVDLLLQAFVSVAAERPEWDLVVLGDGPLRAKLAAMIPAEIASRVRWLGFVDDQKLVSAVYRNCDVLVLPSDVEPWAVVVSEAVAAGLAVVTSDAVGAAAELVRHGQNGAIFPRGDREALLECLLLTTAAGEIERMKQESARILQAWRIDADPIAGLRTALRAALPAFWPREGGVP